MEKFLQKERVSQILLLPLLCLSGLIHILIYNTKIGEKSNMAKSWARNEYVIHREYVLQEVWRLAIPHAMMA